MKRTSIVSLIVLLLTFGMLAEAQTVAPPQAEGTPELRKLLADQQRQIKQLSSAMEQQKKQIEEQNKIIESILKTESAASNEKPEAFPPRPPRLGEVASVSGIIPNASPSIMAPPLAAPQKAEAEEPSPLAFHIGSAYFTPIGFADLTTVFRSADAGNSLPSSWGSIPFNNTTNGRLTELRMSAQNSRFGFRVDTKVGRTNVLGYMEADFVGFAPVNVAVTSNGDSLRLRLYWVDTKFGKFELLGGQSWSMLTPNRKGLSPLPADVFYSQAVDSDYHNGLVWSRDPQFRMVYHFTDDLAWGLSLENPEQYIGGSGGGGVITLPSALTTAYATVLDNGGTTFSASNVHPDIISKIAYDGKMAGNRGYHVEVAGLLSTFRLFNPLNSNHYARTGGGGSVNLNFELVKNFRVLTNNFWSDGGGRWLFGEAPDLIVLANGAPSPLHAGSTMSGLEWTIGNNALSAYYGGVYIGRASTIDPSTGKPVGYGFTGSPNSQNRSIQEITFDFNRTFWKDPKYGALNLLGQYSYLFRNPWYVAPNQPKDAHLNLIYVGLRYTLPGSAPTIK